MYIGDNLYLVKSGQAAVAAVVAYHLWLPQYYSHVEASRIMSLVWESEAALEHMQHCHGWSRCHLQ